jgi:BirA family biotin operon repressor/biotin-[acetyl-CoA-carboxylase] ligase
MTQPCAILRLETSIGREVRIHDRLASTNTTALELARQADSHGLAVVARFQTNGRGQYGRVWQSQPDRSLLMSVVLHPPAELRGPVVLTAFAAVAVAKAIRRLSGAQARIKWPNDLLIGGKKVCGILIEQHGPASILGIGLNLNQTADQFTEAGLADATSLGIVRGAAMFEVSDVAMTVLRELDREYCRLLNGERTAVEVEWKRRIGLVGKDVVVEAMDGGASVGYLHEMSFEGLVLETETGTRLVVPESVRHVSEPG